MNIRAYSLMKNPRSSSMWIDVQFSNRTIVAKIVRKLKGWLLVIKIIKHNCKWRIVACSYKLDVYIIQDFL
jgi:hypothetical protein